MEEKFYLDDFELSLKEHANQFKMAPSKKVWQGIYNDLHPGRRWPSVMMSLLLISSIIFIGYINTHADKKLVDSKSLPLEKNEKKDALLKSKSADKNYETSTKQIVLKYDKTISYKQNKTNQGSVSFTPTGYNNISINKDIVRKEMNTEVSEIVSAENLDAIEALPNVTENDDAYTLNYQNTSDKNRTSKESVGVNSKEEIIGDGFSVLLADANLKNIESKIFDGDLNAKTILLENNTLVDENFLNVLYIDLVNTESSSQESNNVILKRAKKRNEKIRWIYFAAPLVSTVLFKGEPLKQNVSLNSISSLPQVTQKDMRVLRNATLGYEAGIQMNYLLTKKLQLTAGPQITHSGYSIISNEVHPTLTTLLLKDPSTGNTYSRNFVTHYGDGTGQSITTLHNYNVQASLPVGLQYVMWENQKLQINIASDFGPSIALKTDAYILSSDGKNYVRVPDLLRRWNFSSNFGAFVTFRSGRYKWNIGPNVRYQWLSTYQEDYTVKEHLIDYGIRVGISK